MGNTITINYDSTNRTLTASPSPLYTDPPRTNDPGVTVTFAVGTNLSSIGGVRISGQNFQPFNGSQPYKTLGVWHWYDAHTTTSTYEYVVSADVRSVGARTLDPQIINTTRAGG